MRVRREGAALFRVLSRSGLGGQSRQAVKLEHATTTR